MALLLRSSPLRPSPSPGKLSKLSKLSLQLPPSCRSFHASPKPQFIVTVTHDALTALHSFTGLPWAYTLPLFALTLRTTLILPLSIYQRRATQRRVALIPLIQSWRYALQKETMREAGHLGPVGAQNILMHKLRTKRKELYRRWRCGSWKNFLGLAQLPVFLATMEAIRGMAGSHQGWWGMITSSEFIKVGVERTDAVLTADGLVKTPLIPVESTFATEGALWFPDLLVPDPQLILPFLLSGAILLNIFGHRPAQMGVWQTRFTRSMGIVALAVGPIMMHVPSALVLYWVSSSMLAYGQSLLLERLVPIQKRVTPCQPKRPMKSGLGLPVEGKAQGEEL